MGIHTHDRHLQHAHTHTYAHMHVCTHVHMNTHARRQETLCIGGLAVSPYRRPTAHIQVRKWVFHIQETLTASEGSFCGLSSVGLERK